jgi:hypothetical protein
MASIMEVIAARRAGQTAPAVPQDPQDVQVPGLTNAIKEVGAYGLGVVAAVGNTLDIPRTVAWDAVLGENPIDQLATPFSAENRLGGRDVLTRMGITKKNREGGVGDWWGDPEEAVSDLGGFAMEVLLDPLGPIGAAFKIPRLLGLTAKTGARAALGVTKGVASLLPGGRFAVGATEEVLTYARKVAHQLYNYKRQATTDPRLKNIMESMTDGLIRSEDQIQSVGMAALGEMERKGFHLRTDHPDFLANLRAVRLHVEGVDDIAKQLRPDWKLVPDEIKPYFKEMKAATLKRRIAEAGSGLRTPAFVDDAGIEYWHRRMLDTLKHLVTEEELSVPGTSNFFRQFSTEGGENALRDLLFKGNKLGTEGLQEVLTDPQWTQIAEETSKLVGADLAEGFATGRLRDAAGPAHLKKFAEAVGLSTRQLWTDLGLSMDQPYARTADLTDALEKYRAAQDAAVQVGKAPSRQVSHQVNGQDEWWFYDLFSGKPKALRKNDAGEFVMPGRPNPEAVVAQQQDALLNFSKRAARKNAQNNPDLLARLERAEQSGAGFLSYFDDAGNTQYLVPRLESVLNPNWKGRLQKLARSIAKGPVEEMDIVRNRITHQIETRYSDVILRDMPASTDDGKVLFKDQTGRQIAKPREDVLNPSDHFRRQMDSGELTQVMEDRYENLADLITRREKVREFGLFGNNPVVDWIDGELAGQKRIEVAQALMKLVTDTVVEQHGTTAASWKPGRVAITRFDNPLGVSVDKLLKSNKQISKPAFLDLVAKRLEEHGVYKFDEKLAEPGRHYTKELARTITDTKLDPRMMGELQAAFEYFAAPPEVGKLGQLMDSYLAIHKSGLLSTPSTVFRDTGSGIVNAIAMGDLPVSPAGIGRFKDAAALARGRDVAGEIAHPDVIDMVKRMGLDPNNNSDRGRAFVYLYAGAMHRSHMHAQLGSDLPARLKSGQADDILDQIPNQRREGSLESLKRMWGSQSIGAQLAPWNVPGVVTKTPAGYGPRSTENIVAALHGAVRGTADNTIRMSSILNNMDKGMSFRDAFERVNWHQVSYDPRRYTRFEKQVMKRAIPFYSFISRSLPMVAMELASHPGGGLGRVIRAQRLAQGKEENYVPYDLQDSAAIPLSPGQKGELRYITNLGLMHEDALRYLAPTEGVRGILKRVVGSSNPLVKGVVEYATNTSTFFDGPMGGRRLDDLDPAVGRILHNMGLTQLPPSGRPNPFISPMVEAAAANSPAAAALRYARVISEPLKRRSISEKMVNLLTGVRTKNITQEALARELRDRLNAEQIRMGARPISIVTGTEGLAERYEAAGDEGAAEKLERISRTLAVIRKRLQQQKIEK